MKVCLRNWVFPGSKKRERGKKKDSDDGKDRKKKKKKDKKEGIKGAVTNSWGKYGIIRETDMWNKRPEFSVWLSEVKEVNLETVPNWEEKQLFKQFMEDHNTATFPSKKESAQYITHHVFIIENGMSSSVRIGNIIINTCARLLLLWFSIHLYVQEIQLHSL